MHLENISYEKQTNHNNYNNPYPYGTTIFLAEEKPF